MYVLRPLFCTFLSHFLVSKNVCYSVMENSQGTHLEQITHITVSGKILKGRTWNKEHVLRRQRKLSRDVFGTNNIYYSVRENSRGTHLEQITYITVSGKILKERIWNK
jgi:hypothetical protein